MYCRLAMLEMIAEGDGQATTHVQAQLFKYMDVQQSLYVAHQHNEVGHFTHSLNNHDMVSRPSYIVQAERYVTQQVVFSSIPKLGHVLGRHQDSSGPGTYTGDLSPNNSSRVCRPARYPPTVVAIFHLNYCEGVPSSAT
jgi:hypothetical protein